MSKYDWNELLSGCVSFADAPFNYLIITFSNNREEILPIGFLFSKQMFVDFKKTNGSNANLLLEKLHPPYPIYIDTQILDCFHGKYNLPKVNVGIGSIPFMDIAEEFYIYIMLLDSLTKAEDAEYLRAELKNVQANIEGQTRLLGDYPLIENFNRLLDILYNAVFNGEEFDDDSLKRLIDTFSIDEFVDALQIDDVYKNFMHNLGKYVCRFPEEGDSIQR